jgi:hypothetical protein
MPSIDAVFGAWLQLANKAVAARTHRMFFFIFCFGLND